MKLALAFLLVLQTILVTAQETKVTSAEIAQGFGLTEEVPIFPGCEKTEKKDSFRCFQSKIYEHIKVNFRYPEKALNQYIQGRVLVTYVINIDGKIIDISATGGELILQKEAIRIISLLPKMTPGTQKGVPVKVRYSVPITFKLR